MLRRVVFCTAFVLIVFLSYHVRYLYAQASSVSATVETKPVPHSGDAADDPVIWVNRANPAESTMLGTDKAISFGANEGGIGVYKIKDGSEVQFLTGAKFNNIDLREGFPLAGGSVSLIGANDRSGKVWFYKVNPTDGKLTHLATLQGASFAPYGFCMYKSKTTGKFYYFVTAENVGKVEQYEIKPSGNTVTTQKITRNFSDITKQSEGCVADDELGHLYIAEEKVGIWKYPAESDAGFTPKKIANIGQYGLKADIEGLTMAYGENGTGYLFASNQGDSSYAVFNRAGDNAFVKLFKVVDGNGHDGTSDTDGIDVYAGNLGTGFTKGAFVVQDGANNDGNQNFKIVPLEAIVTMQTPGATIPPTGQPTVQPTGVAPTQPGATAVPTASRPDGNGCTSGSPEADCFEKWVGEYTGTISTVDTDFNNDGAITLVDYEIWRRAIPQTSVTIAPTQPGATTAPTAVQPTSVQSTPVPTSTGGTAGQSKGYLTNATELKERKRFADQGQEPYKSAVANLMSFANGKLGGSPSPQTSISIPGTTGPFVDDANAVYGLGLAYGLTGDAKYAQKARQYIMAWVNGAKKTTNTCPDSGGCQTSLIIGRAGAGFVFGADLIKPSGALSSADDQAFKQWLKVTILPTASIRDNNWGDAGTFLRVAVTDYIGDTAGFNAAIAKWKAMVDLIDPAGFIPEEVRRGSSGMTYTEEALDYKIAVAKIAERRGMNLWSYGRLKLAVDYIAKYMTNPSSWPHASGAKGSGHPFWEIAYQQWKDPKYKAIISSERPVGEYHNALSFSTLTNGTP